MLEIFWYNCLQQASSTPWEAPYPRDRKQLKFHQRSSAGPGLGPGGKGHLLSDENTGVASIGRVYLMGKW